MTPPALDPQDLQQRYRDCRTTAIKYKQQVDDLDASVSVNARRAEELRTQITDAERQLGALRSELDLLLQRIDQIRQERCDVYAVQQDAIARAQVLEMIIGFFTEAPTATETNPQPSQDPSDTGGTD